MAPRNLHHTGRPIPHWLQNNCYRNEHVVRLKTILFTDTSAIVPIFKHLCLRHRVLRRPGAAGTSRLVPVKPLDGPIRLPEEDEC